MGKTFVILAAFASTALIAGTASAGGRNSGYHAPQPVVSLGVGAKVGGLLGAGVGATVGGGSLLNLGVAAKTPVATAGVGAKVGGASHGGGEISLGADLFGGGVGR